MLLDRSEGIRPMRLSNESSVFAAEALELDSTD